MSHQTAEPPPSTVRDLYDLVTGEDDARVCRDISAAQCREQPANFFVHLPALIANKAGDELASAKVTLPWLLGAVGAPGWMLGMLVPLREALALLPQLVVAGAMRRLPQRKWCWVGGAVVQGICVLAMAAVAATLRDSAAGLAILALLAIFALGRGVCSVAYKDVQGKTISKGRRGTLSGYATSAGGAIALAFAGWLLLSPPTGLTALMLLLGLAGGLWLLAAAVFAALREEPGATEGGGNALEEAMASLSLLREAPDFGRFVAVRALLTASALAAPFYVELARGLGTGTQGLAWLLIASGLAAFLSGPFWGRAADTSSRRLMLRTGLLVAALNLAVLGLAVAGAGLVWLVLAYFLLAVLHAGVRLGRKTYLVDLADASTRARYTAVSNTVIGVALLAGGALVGAAAQLGPAVAVAVLTVPAAAGALLARQLPEVG